MNYLNLDEFYPMSESSYEDFFYSFKWEIILSRNYKWSSLRNKYFHVHTRSYYLTLSTSYPSDGFSKDNIVMQLHTGTEHFGNAIKRGTAKRGCS